MKTYLLIIAACLVFAPSALAQKILTDKDFDFGWNEAVSDQDTPTFKLEINPNLPPVTVQLVRDTSAKAEELSTYQHSVGKIEIFPGNGSASQEIDVKAHTYSSVFIKGFLAMDINFDGYLDIAVLD